MTIKIYADGPDGKARLLATYKNYTETAGYFRLYAPNLRGVTARVISTNLKKDGNIYKIGKYTIKQDCDAKDLGPLEKSDIKKVNKELKKAPEKKGQKRNREGRISKFIERKFIPSLEIETYCGALKILEYVDRTIRRMHFTFARRNRVDINNTFYSIALIQNENREEGTPEKSYSTGFLNLNFVLGKLDNTLRDYFQGYDVGLIIDKLYISYYEPVEFGEELIFGNSKNGEFLTDYLRALVFEGRPIDELTKLLNKYVVLSPVTNKNCLIQALFMSKQKTRNVNIISKKYILNNNLSDTDRTINNFVPKFCLDYNLSCEVLDGHTMNLKKFGNGKETIRIFVFGSHAYSLINKNDTIEKTDVNYKDAHQEKIENIKYVDKYGNFDICTYDMETANDKKNKVTPYAVGFYDGEVYADFKQITGDKLVIRKFLDFLIYKNSKKNIILYAHNGGKFDTWLMLEEILKYGLGRVCNIVCNAGRIINIVYNVNGKNIIFRDSYCFINMSLREACKSFNTKVKKGEIDHNSINIDNCFTKETYDKVKDYLKSDCISLMEILKAHDKVIKKHCKFSVKEVLTNASVARRDIAQNYYNAKKTPFYSVPEKIQAELRPFYHGGNNQCLHKLGSMGKGKYYVYDVNSSYPNEMEKQFFPYGEMDINTNFDNINDRFGFIRCKIIHDKPVIKAGKIKPFHCFQHEGKLVFPYLEKWRETIITTEELKYSLKHKLGYRYKYIKFYEYKNYGKIFSNIVNKWYSVKQSAKESNNTALLASAKIIINSLSGFFGINLFNKECITLNKGSSDQKNEATFNKLLKTGSLINTKKVGDYDLYHHTKTMRSDFSNLSISMFCTSYARTALYDIIRRITKKGGIVYYCDTDSVITNMKLEDDTDMKHMIGDKLGQLKNESGKEGGHFDNLVILGNKSYALPNKIVFKGFPKNNKYTSKIINEADKSITLKGIDNFKGKHEFTFGDYELMAKGYTLNVDNMYFCGGINNILINDDGLVKKDVTKKFKMFYDKGTLDSSNYIKPLII
jgi:hypothetical protein